ncbi:hypothetical protein K440DRAFT_645312 [Wilcoxina mikolae CBS 423.85]|nr:hypothetical protein K440DRAFT_645312 [Wilcoxina mikolae CBS 423.85]
MGTPSNIFRIDGTGVFNNFAISSQDNDTRKADETIISYRYFVGNESNVEKPDIEDTDANPAPVNHPPADFTSSVSREHAKPPFLSLSELKKQLPRYHIGSYPKGSSDSTKNTQDYLQIIEFLDPEDRKPLQRFLKILKDCEYPDASSFPEELSADFAGGIRAVGTFAPAADIKQEDKSVLFVSIPFLSFDSGAESGLQVHKAEFMVVDNCAIATFRSNGSKHPLLLPGQRRVGAFHVLAHMMSGLIASTSRILLEGFTEKVSGRVSTLLFSSGRVFTGSQDLEIQTLASALIEATKPSERDELLRKARATIITASKELGEAAAVTRVIKTQLRVLKDFRNIVSNSYNTESTARRGYPTAFTKNIVKIPVIWQQTEQIPYVIDMIEQTMDEYKYVSREVQELIKLVRMSQNSYFALDSAKKTINTQGLFWAITAPITTIFFLAAVVIVLCKNYHRLDLVRAVYNSLHSMKWERPPTKKEKWEKEKKRQENSAIPLEYPVLYGHRPGDSQKTFTYASIPKRSGEFVENRDI